MDYLVNFQKILEEVIEDVKFQMTAPTLLLHSCCAPCSTYVLDYLMRYFKITVFYYNPNIYPQQEYEKRLNNQKKLILQMNQEFNNGINFIEGEYCNIEFYKNFMGLELEPEGGRRCELCYRLRLEETAKMACKNKFDYFTTTLTISPHKNAQTINDIGKDLADKYNVKYLFSDFKKKEGYKKSIELSKEYEIYRQNYCGCVFSKRD